MFKKLLIYLITAILMFPIINAQQSFDILICSDISSNAVLLGIFTFFALFLILLGVLTNVGFIGLFGAVILLVLSIYISPCINIFGFALALLSLLLFFFFIFRGRFPSTTDNRK